MAKAGRRWRAVIQAAGTLLVVPAYARLLAWILEHPAAAQAAADVAFLVAGTLLLWVAHPVEGRGR